MFDIYDTSLLLKYKNYFCTFYVWLLQEFWLQQGYQISCHNPPGSQRLW